MTDLMARFTDYLYMLPAVIISLTVHEYSHAFVADRLGDPTPRADKRLSLNPIHHIDPLGFIVMLLVRFGWAKPVRVNPMYFKDPKKGMLLTALAGPLSNLCLCFVFSLPLFFSVVFSWHEVLSMFFYYMTLLNIGLAVFNLIPVHPLDGSRIISYFFPGYASFMARYGGYVQIAFIVLLVLPDFLGLPDLLGLLIVGLQTLVGTGLMRLWALIFKFLL